MTCRPNLLNSRPQRIGFYSKLEIPACIQWLTDFKLGARVSKIHDRISITHALVFIIFSGCATLESPTSGIFDEFDIKVDKLLTERGRALEAEPKDLLARLISARDTETGGGMTAKEVRDQVVTIFMAGHETTAQALSWTFYLLSQHPDVEGKLHDELTTLLAGRTPRHEDLGELRYTRTQGSVWHSAALRASARERGLLRFCEPNEARSATCFQWPAVSPGDFATGS